MIRFDPEVFESTDLLKYVHKVISSFWEQETVPCNLKEVLLRPFIKDNTKDVHDPSNYRTISLLNTLLKIYEGIIHKRIVSFLEKNIGFHHFSQLIGRIDQPLTIYLYFKNYFWNIVLKNRQEMENQKKSPFIGALWI